MLDTALLLIIATVSIVHLMLAFKVLIPLARPQVDLPATLEAMAEDLRETIQQEVRLLEDRERKRRDRTPVETDGQIPAKVVAGQPYRPGG